jgi:membrane protein YqaA with SNARE-associated domain
MSFKPSPLYERITHTLDSRGTLFIAFLWGLAEATVFFVVPDIYLGFVAIFSWRKGLLSTAYIVAGAMVGGAIMYGLASNNPATINQFLTKIPLISANMLNSVRVQLENSGLYALVNGPLQGIPYKVYAVEAGAQALPVFQFLLITIIARLERILPVALFGVVTGRIFRKFIQRFTIPVVCVYLALWAGVYVLYYFQLR